MTGFLDDIPVLHDGRRRQRRPKRSGPAKVVAYVKIRCPACGSMRVPTQRTEPAMEGHRIRFHRCQDCDWRFSSVEEVEDDRPLA